MNLKQRINKFIWRIHAINSVRPYFGWRAAIPQYITTVIRFVRGM